MEEKKRDYGREILSNDKMMPIKIRNLVVHERRGRLHLYSLFTKKTFQVRKIEGDATLFEFTFSITNARHDEKLVEEIS